MKAEFDALRRIARLAADCLATASLREEDSESGTLQALRAALSDLEHRFPYTLEPRSLVSELHARVSNDRV